MDIDSRTDRVVGLDRGRVDYETKGNARRPLRAGRRLGCAAAVLDDAVISVPSESQVHRQVVRKTIDLTGLVIDPQFTLYNVDVPKAVLGDSESVTELIGEAVLKTHDVTVRTWSTTVLRAAHKAAANDHASVTIAVDRDGVAVAIWPGFVDTALGVAIDVGSTTVAGHLCDLSTRRSAGDRRADEPADPLRRGPDEPGVVRDDEPRRREGADRRASAPRSTN